MRVCVCVRERESARKRERRKPVFANKAGSYAKYFKLNKSTQLRKVKKLKN